MLDSAVTAELKTLCAERSGGGGPLYRRLKDALVSLIEAGTLPDGCRLPPDMQWAAEIGVSHVTLAKALNELRKFGLVERGRLQGTFVRTQRTYPQGQEERLIALLYDTVDHRTFDSELFVTLHEELSRAGFRILFLSAAGDPQRQKRQLQEVMQDAGCHGCIIWSLLDDAAMADLMPHRPLHWPIVFIEVNHGEPVHQYGDVVIYDGQGAAEQIGRRYFEQGGRRVIFLGTERHLAKETIQMRLRGLQTAAEAVLSTRAAKEAVKVMVCAESMSRQALAALLDRADGSLLMVAAGDEVCQLQAAARQKAVDLERLMPAVGFGLTSLGPRWALPQVLFSPVYLAQHAVATLIHRSAGDRGAFRQVRVRGEGMTGADLGLELAVPPAEATRA